MDDGIPNKDDGIPDMEGGIGLSPLLSLFTVGWRIPGSNIYVLETGLASSRSQIRLILWGPAAVLRQPER